MDIPSHWRSDFSRGFTDALFPIASCLPTVVPVTSFAPDLALRHLPDMTWRAIASGLTLLVQLLYQKKEHAHKIHKCLVLHPTILGDVLLDVSGGAEYLSWISRFPLRLFWFAKETVASQLGFLVLAGWREVGSCFNGFKHFHKLTSLTMENHYFLMGKSTMSMSIFNSYGCFPEGIDIWYPFYLAILFGLWATRASSVRPEDSFGEIHSFVAVPWRQDLNSALGQHMIQSYPN